MTALLKLGWTAGADRAGERRKFDIVTTLAAALMITVSTAAGLLEQARVDNEPTLAQRRGSDDPSRPAPGREMVIGAYTGAPYNYPSSARVVRPGAVDFTIDPINWYTDPFKSPIYYGARVQRWFAGGRTGGMVDFIHSKAIAPQEQETGFSGTIDGQPLPPRARIAEITNKLEFSHGHNMLLLNGLIRLPGLGARVSPYAGAGVGASLPHTEFQLTNGSRPRTYEYNYAGPATQALLGVEIRLPGCPFSSSTSSPTRTTRRRCPSWTEVGCHSTSGGRQRDGLRASRRRAGISRPSLPRIRSSTDSPCASRRRQIEPRTRRRHFQPRHIDVHAGAGAR